MADSDPAAKDAPANPSDAPNAPAQSSAQTHDVQSEPAPSTSAQPAPTACAQCGKAPESLKQCIKCHSVSYCNKDCQKVHFKAHKKACPILAQEYVKSHEPKMASRSSGAAKGAARERGLQKWQVCEIRTCDDGFDTDVLSVRHLGLCVKTGVESAWGEESRN